MQAATFMETEAVVLDAPQSLGVQTVPLTTPGPRDLVIRVDYSGISTGTEKLFYTGKMPPFPGMGYPLIPGYESAGEVIEAGAETGFARGDHVFVPGANCYGDGIKGLFGGAARILVSDVDRVTRIDRGHGRLVG